MTLAAKILGNPIISRMNENNDGSASDMMPINTTAEILTQIGINVGEVSAIEGEGSSAAGDAGQVIYFSDSMVFNKTGQSGVITYGEGVLTIDFEESPDQTYVYTGDVNNINDVKNALVDPTNWEVVDAEDNDFDPEEDDAEGDEILDEEE
jgi:hypothetical protein